MNGRMALCTPCRCCRTDVHVFRNLKMDMMALQTEKRLGFDKQVVYNRAMWIVACLAALNNSGMLELKWSLFVGVASVAKVVGIRTSFDTA